MVLIRKKNEMIFKPKHSLALHMLYKICEWELIYEIKKENLNNWEIIMSFLWKVDQGDTKVEIWIHCIVNQSS